MTNKEILKLWTKKMLRQGLTPTCLICVDNDGFPHVLSQHKDETLRKVYKHLAEASLESETTSFDGQEN